MIFKNETDFSLYIEEESIRKNSSCIDTLIEYCEDNDLDVNDISSLVNRSLKERLANEYAERNMLKLQNTQELEF